MRDCRKSLYELLTIFVKQKISAFELSSINVFLVSLFAVIVPMQLTERKPRAAEHGHNFSRQLIACVATSSH